MAVSREEFTGRIFSGTANQPLAQKIAQSLDQELGAIEVSRFNDGEISVEFGENLRGRDVFLVQPTNPPFDNLGELLIMIDAARRASTKRITAVISYFCYARQDHKDKPRVPITAKLVANLITTAGADRVLTLDLHSPQIQGFFDIPVDHLYARPVFLRHIRQTLPNNELAVVAPDAGGVAMARSYAKRLGLPLVIVDKRRPKPNRAEVVHIIGGVDGKIAIPVDDMTDTARTLVEGAKALKKAGAREVRPFATHAILSKGGAKRIDKSPAISKLVVTDSILLPPRKRNLKIEVVSVAPLLAKAIYCINQESSVSSLFEE